MIDFVAVVRRESDRFRDVLDGVPLDGRVPTCPDWSVAELIWHLTEVQHFWASIVGDLLTDPDQVPNFERPLDGELLDALSVQTARLTAALAAHGADEHCWSWHEQGRSVGWSRRRQAHEAFVHRVDAELSTGAQSTIDPTLAADGVDELVMFFLDLDNLPDWATYDRDGTTVRIEIDQGEARTMAMGRFAGASPNTGNVYDFPAVQIVDEVTPPTTIITGTASDLDLWLWGRGPIEHLTVRGDPAIAGLLRRAAAEGTR